MQKVFKKSMIPLLFNVFCITPTLPMVAPLRNRAPVVTNACKRATVARLSTTNQPIAPTSRGITPSTQKRMPKRQGSSSRGGGNYQGSWQQARVQDAIKKALGITGAVTIAAVMAEATGIADFARNTFFMYMFDENLISDEFSRAIVKIYTKKGKCSGFIVASDNYRDLYFVLTAAHCLKPEGNNYVLIKHPQYSDKDIKIELTQILIEPSTDIAVLLIPSEEIRKFQYATGTELPAIPAKQLARVKPRKNEVILLQGYPGKVPFKNVYREKFMSKGPATIVRTGQKISLTKLTSIEQHLPEPLCGASGAPYIVIRDNSPEVQGIHAEGEYYTGKKKVRTGVTYGGGFGKLPHYLEKAEKNARDLQEAENMNRQENRDLLDANE